MYFTIIQKPNGDYTLLDNSNAADLETGVEILKTIAQNHIVENVGSIKAKTALVGSSTDFTADTVADGMYLVDVPLNTLDSHPFFKGNSAEFRESIRYCMNVVVKNTALVEVKGYLFGSSTQAERRVTVECCYILRHFKESRTGIEASTADRGVVNIGARVQLKHSFANVLADIARIHLSRTDASVERPQPTKFTKSGKLTESVFCSEKLSEFVKECLNIPEVVDNIRITRKDLYELVRQYVIRQELYTKDSSDHAKNKSNEHDIRDWIQKPRTSRDILGQITCDPKLGELVGKLAGTPTTLYSIQRALEKHLSVTSEQNAINMRLDHHCNGHESESVKSESTAEEKEVLVTLPEAVRIPVPPPLPTCSVTPKRESVCPINPPAFMMDFGARHENAVVEECIRTGLLPLDPLRVSLAMNSIEEGFEAI